LRPRDVRACWCGLSVCSWRLLGDRRREFNVTVTVVTVTRTRRTTDRCPPPEAQTRSTTLRTTYRHAHTTSHVAALPELSRDHATTHKPLSLPDEHTSYQRPTSSPIQLQLPSQINMLRRLLPYTNPHPTTNPRQSATPPAPHQQLPPRPLVDTTQARAQNHAQRSRCLYVGPNQRNRFEDADAKTTETKGARIHDVDLPGLLAWVSFPPRGPCWRDGDFATEAPQE